MKKLLAVILAMLLCVSLFACGGKGGDTESVEDKVKDAVESQIQVNIMLQYDTTGVPSITYYVDKIGENVFEVTGKVTVRDKYGDTYTGNYDAEVEYNPSTDKCKVDCDIDKLYKN